MAEWESLEAESPCIPARVLQEYMSQLTGMNNGDSLASPLYEHHPPSEAREWYDPRRWYEAAARWVNADASHDEAKGAAAFSTQADVPEWPRHCLTSHCRPASGVFSAAYPGACSAAYPGACSAAHPGACSAAHPGACSSAPAYPGACSAAYPGACSAAYPGACSSAPAYPGACRAAFEAFGRSGFLDYRELHNALYYYGLNVSTVKAQGVLRAYDDQSDGRLAMSEFARLVADLERSAASSPAYPGACSAAYPSACSSSLPPAYPGAARSPIIRAAYAVDSPPTARTTTAVPTASPPPKTRVVAAAPALAHRSKSLGSVASTASVSWKPLPVGPDDERSDDSNITRDDDADGEAKAGTEERRMAELVANQNHEAVAYGTPTDRFLSRSRRWRSADREDDSAIEAPEVATMEADQQAAIHRAKGAMHQALSALCEASTEPNQCKRPLTRDETDAPWTLCDEQGVPAAAAPVARRVHLPTHEPSSPPTVGGSRKGTAPNPKAVLPLGDCNEVEA